VRSKAEIEEELSRIAAELASPENQRRLTIIQIELLLEIRELAEKTAREVHEVRSPGTASRRCSSNHIGPW
jgi:hypothetical protein